MLRGIFLLGLGGVIGAGALFAFTATDFTFHPGDHGPGGGTARISFDEPALSAIAGREVAELVAPNDSSVSADVQPSGLVVFTITVGRQGVGIKGDVALEPIVSDGKLDVRVVRASIGDLGLPADVAERIEAPLRERLDALGGVAYRLTHVETSDDQLTLEVALEG